jgi:hypothetical protein
MSSHSLTPEEFLKVAEIALESGSLKFPIIICGHVLVQRLQDMCINRGIEVDQRTTSEHWLNDTLFELNVYDVAKHSEIKEWIDMLLAGHRGDFSFTQVKSLCAGVTNFRESFK